MFYSVENIDLLQIISDALNNGPVVLQFLEPANCPSFVRMVDGCEPVVDGVHVSAGGVQRDTEVVESSLGGFVHRDPEKFPCQIISFVQTLAFDLLPPG